VKGRAHQRQSGFTLVELIMVLVIMGALSAVAMSKFNRNSFDVAAAAGELVQAIRYAQDKSMSHSGAADYRVVITGSGYTVDQGVATPVTHPITGAANYTRTWADITLDTTVTISFDSYGDPGLGAPVTITLSKGSDNDGVTVEDVTGFVR
jgi:prepilin-type N-terminal cleavage/methylation domain-containing protein